MLPIRSFLLLHIISISMTSSIFVSHARRQLAHMQLGRFKKAPGFHWLNVAPSGADGDRLSVDRLGAAVVEWFQKGTPLPSEWDGKCLQTLVRVGAVPFPEISHSHSLPPQSPAENKALREYSSTHCTPQMFADEEKVADLMADIERCLQT